MALGPVTDVPSRRRRCLLAKHALQDQYLILSVLDVDRFVLARHNDLII